jgi:hypothetical protein
MVQTCRAAARPALVLFVGFVLLAGSARAQVADAPAAPDPAGASSTPDPESASPVESSPPFWTPRHTGLVAGFGASFAAATVAWLRNRDVLARKQAIQALPAGVPDLWNQQVADAARVLTARDFWRDTAIGIGGFTLGWFVLSPSRDARQIAPPDRVPAPSGRKWLANVHLATPAISVTRFF